MQCVPAVGDGIFRARHFWKLRRMCGLESVHTVDAMGPILARIIKEFRDSRAAGTVRNFACGRAVKHYAAMATLRAFYQAEIHKPPRPLFDKPVQHGHESTGNSEPLVLPVELVEAAQRRLDLHWPCIEQDRNRHETDGQYAGQ